MSKDEALKLALDFVASISPAFICEATHHKKNERHAGNEPCPHVAKQKATYEAIKEALAQLEPVCDKDPQGCWSVRCQLGKKCKNTPPQRPWVGLTDEELPPLVGDNGKYMELQQVRRFYKYIEAKLKEKNT